MDSIANIEDFIELLRVHFECMRLNYDTELGDSGARENINIDTLCDHLVNLNQLGHNKPSMDISNMDSIANMQDCIDVLRVHFECMGPNYNTELGESGAGEHVAMECGHSLSLNPLSDMEIDDMNSTEDINDSIEGLRVDFECMSLTEDMELGETDVTEYMDIDTI